LSRAFSSTHPVQDPVAPARQAPSSAQDTVPPRTIPKTTASITMSAQPGTREFAMASFRFIVHYDRIFPCAAKVPALAQEKAEVKQVAP